jgi:MinD-like ATPase involved in chromosome partitioning or flagellar assembly
MATAFQPLSAPSHRVIFTEGGKGGVGKTAFITGLAEWFDTQQIPYTLLDLDIENKVRGSLTHYFQERTRKVDIHTPEGLNAFLEALTEETPVVIADMGAGSGKAAYPWFDRMHESARELGVAFTAIGVITPDAASVQSVLNWAQALQGRVEYLIVKNALTYPADFSYWEQTAAAKQFRQTFQPREIEMEFRVPQFENLVRRHGVTVGQAAARKVNLPALQQFSVVVRAQAYRRHLFAELERVRKGLLL